MIVLYEYQNFDETPVVDELQPPRGCTHLVQLETRSSIRAEETASASLTSASVRLPLKPGSDGNEAPHTELIPE